MRKTERTLTFRAEKAVNTLKRMNVYVSLTTISKRVEYLPDVLQSILDQTVTPDAVFLWISEEPFLLDDGVRRSDLPNAVVELAEDELSPLEIRCVENTGPHRKLLPLLSDVYHDEEPPLVLTADDDTLYPPRWLETMVAAYEDECRPITFRARRIQTTDDGLAPYEEWPLIPQYEELVSYRLFPTGKDGMLVHPYMFHPDVLTEDFRELCPSRSDAWITASLLAAESMVIKLSKTRVLSEGTLKAAADDRWFGSPSSRSSSASAGSDKLTEYNEDKNDRQIRDTFEYFDVHRLFA